jgi:hypothetical protein
LPLPQDLQELNPASELGIPVRYSGACEKFHNSNICSSPEVPEVLNGAQWAGVSVAVFSPHTESYSVFNKLSSTLLHSCHYIRTTIATVASPVLVLSAPFIFSAKHKLFTFPYV